MDVRLITGQEAGRECHFVQYVCKIKKESAAQGNFCEATQLDIAGLANTVLEEKCLRDYENGCAEKTDKKNLDVE